MTPFTWKLRNFTLGQHTEPAKVGEGSERFARAVSGLRVDGNGHLRPRAGLRPFGREGRTAVTGVATAQNYLLYLRADATLWIVFSHAPGEEREIQFQTPIDGSLASPMTGRLSVIGDYADFAIVKAEGGSLFWIDMREDAPTYLYAYRLGIEPPAFYPQLHFRERGTDQEAIVPRNTMVVWRWTYVRALGSTPEEIRQGVYYARGELFNGMESNPSPPVGVRRAVVVRQPIVDGDGNPVTTISHMGGDDNAVGFSGFTFPDDPQITGVMLYQSAPIPVATRRVGSPEELPSGRINVDGLTYRRVAYLPRGTTTFEYPDASVWTDETWAESPALRFDNDVLPDTRRIYLYNDRIFCPTEQGLRFSDVDGTILRLWAYPEVHAISRAGVRDLVEHRGVLLFGGPTDFYSLAGTSPFDFVVNRLGTTGPISPHSMHVFKDSVAFVGAAGFYGTDGASVQKLSAALDADFEDYEVTSGHCHMLPDDSWLFIVNQAQAVGSPRQLVFHFDAGWFQWPRLSLRQLVRWEAGGIHVLGADETRTLRQVRWNSTDNIGDDEGEDADNLIDWSWESERLNFGDERHKQFRELQLEGQALSVVPQSEARWGLTIGRATLERALAFRIGNKVFGLGDMIWGSSSVAARVRLTVWVDERAPKFYVFEMRRDDYYPLRIPLHQRGKAIRFRLEGRGHLHLRALTLMGAK